MSKEFYSSFITSHRIASGFKTQKEFSEATGITRATVSRMEAGLNRPTPETLQAIAKKLHTTSYTELMVACGYWDEDDLLQPIDKQFVLGESKVKYHNDTKKTPSQDNANEKEFLNEIHLSDDKLKNKFKLIADDRELTDSELRQILAFLRTVRGVNHDEE